MPPKDFYSPAPDGDTSKLNRQRSSLVHWIVSRFHTLLADGREQDSMAFMDEWFEWVDTRTYINESTVFFDGDELNELYEQSKS